MNKFLGVLGVLLLAVAVIGLFLNKSEALAGGFLIGGLALCVMAALAPRLEGALEVGLTGAKFNVAAINDVIQRGENEVRTTTLPEIEEVL